MTAFDWIVLAVLVLSVLAGYARGVVRSLIALLAWIAGLVAAVAFTPALGAALPQLANHPLVPYLVAFVLIFVAALVVGALVAWPLRALVNAAGLGFADRGLGGVFGAVRGAALVMAFVLVAGVTDLPAADWWQNSRLAGPLSRLALDLRHWLPPQWADRLDYSGTGGPPVKRSPAEKEV